MKTTFKKTISVLLSLLMLLSVFGSAGLQAFAATERVKYLGADGSEHWVYDPISMNDGTYELVGGEAGTTWYITGSYVSPNNGDYATLHHGVTVRGDVSLIIRDNLHLTIEGGVYVTENSRLTIYGQSNAPNGVNHYSTGVLSAAATDNAAGIGGKEGARGGHIVVNSGCVEACGEDGAGIGGGYDEGSGFQSVTINGGIVRATGGAGGAGIGDGAKNTKSGGAVITVNGGDVTAYGGDGGAGIGGGKNSESANISVTVNGGTVNTIGGENGAGVGGGQNRGNGKVSITGGTVTATGGKESAGIGGGSEGSAEKPVYISGGEVNIYGSTRAAGIGGGYRRDGNDVYISGGTVYVRSGLYADGIGCGQYNSVYKDANEARLTGNTYITGGRVTVETEKPQTETNDLGSAIACTEGYEIRIENAFVQATAYGFGAGLGGNNNQYRQSGTINIKNAYVIATSVDGPGIGRQGNPPSSNRITENHAVVNIENSCVFAASRDRGAGIGGGNDGDGCTVTIKDSEVTAIGGAIDYNWYAEHGPIVSRFKLVKLQNLFTYFSGLYVNAALTALNHLTRSGKYRGAGIGGGDKGKGGSVTIINSDVLAVGGGDGARAIGHGHDTDATNGTLTLGGNMAVFAGADEDSLSPAAAGNRNLTAFNNYVVHFYPCEHTGADFRSLPDGHAVESCAYCETTFDENNLSAHTFGADKKCAVCGYQGVQVTYSSGNFEGSMAPVVNGKDAVLTLPEAGEFDCERYGYLQSGWLIDGVVYAFGDRVVISKDTTITAVYDIAHDVFIVDSEGGVVTSDKSFVLSGETINLAAKADKGYSFTGVRVRANGNTVYEKNGNSLEASHSFTMPDANVAIYSVFTKNVYHLTTDDDGFGVNVESSAATASVGDRITVSVPKINGVEGIVVTELASGQTHTVPLNAAGKASFVFDWESDVRITPGGLHAHDGVVFTPWGANESERNSLPASGSVFLVGDIVLNEAYAPRKNVDICLNGHTITISDAYSDPYMFNMAAAQLCVCDHDNTGVIDARGKCGLVSLYNARFTLNGGTLTGGSADTGSVITIAETNDYEKYSGFTMHGGVITGNTGRSQGIVNTGNAPICIDGGTITGNTAPTAITVQKNCLFELSGDPVITDNIPTGHSYQSNVLLLGGVINVKNRLSDAAGIGVSVNAASGSNGHVTFTNGFSGNGTSGNFISDDDAKAVGIFDGEAALGVPATVHFDKNGGFGADMDDVRLAKGSQYTLPACLFTPTSGVFAGWRIGSGSEIRQPNETITVSGDLILYAVWDENADETAFIEPHVHRWELKTDAADPSKATVRCVNAISECNESDARWAMLTVDGQSGPCTKVYDGSAVSAGVEVQKASPEAAAFFDGSLISIGSVSYYDGSGNKLSGAPVDAGTYTAMAMLSPVNGKGLPCTLRQTITIAKAAAPEITVSGVDIAPRATAQPMAEVSDVSAYGTVFTRLNGGNWTPGICDAKEPGEYTVEWYFEGRNHENVNSREAPGTVHSSISDVHSHDGIDFIRWTGTDSLPTQPGNYFLTENVNLISDWTPEGDIRLCLFGKTVDLNENYFVIRDCSISLFGDGEGTVTGAGGIFVGSEARLDSHGVIYDQIINGFSYSKFDGMGAALMVSGAFQMDGGRLVNSHGYTGGLQLGPDSGFSVSGSPVIQNNTGNGGKTRNVYLAGSSNLIHIEDGLTGYASIGLYANAFNGGDEEYVLTDNFASHCPGLLPAEVFSLDNALDSTYMIGLSDAGNAVIRHHVHQFEIKLSDGRTDMAEFRCLNEDGCPLHGQIVTAQVFAEDAVYDGEEHGGYLQVLIDGVPAESSYGDEIVIDLSGRKHLYFVDVTYYDKNNTRVDRFYRDENGKIVWVDCAPYEEGTYTAKAWLIYNDFADDTEERVEISAPITIHSHKATEAVIENEIAGTCLTPACYDEVVYCSVCGEEMSRETKTGDFGAHVETPIPGTAADCAHTGLTEGVKCSVCGRLLRAQTVIEKTEHTPGEAVRENEIAASCSAAGSYDEVVSCTVCGTKLSRETKTIEKTAHTPGKAVRENEIAATCSAKGSYDEVVSCSVCGTELSRETKAVEKIAHTPGEAVRENETAATVDAEGGYDTVVYCAICGEELSCVHVTLEKLSPDPTEPADPIDPTDSTDTENGPCKYCGRDHSGSFIQRIIGFFHLILYFFAHLFRKM